LYEVGESDITKEWKSEMKKLKAKVSSKKEIIATNAYMKQMGEKPIDIYAVVEAKEKGIYELSVAVNLGGAYLSKSMHPDKYEVMELFIKDFAKKLVVSAIQDQIKTATKDLEKREKEFDKLVGDNENLHENIKNWEAAIIQAEKDIVQNVKDQEAKKKEIEDAKKILEFVKDKLNQIK